MHRLLVLGLLLLTACPPKESASVLSQNDCFEPSSATVKQLQPDETDPEALGNLRAVVIHRCTEDAWSSEAKTCITGAQSQEQLKECWYKHLAQAQQDKLNRAAAMLSIKNPPDAQQRGFGVTGIEPQKGDARGGATITVTGNRFIADGPRHLKVFFGTRQGSVVRFVSDSELIVQAPSGKEGESVDLRFVFDPGGEIRLPKAFTFVPASEVPQP
jgi:hypothetical protein